MEHQHRPDLDQWLHRFFDDPEMLRMGHNQRAEDQNLGLGWLYYAIGRIVRPSRAVVIGSYRGFVPAILGRALGDNLEPGEVLFIDPSMVDNFWTDPVAVRKHFDHLDAPAVRHFLMTTQEFIGTPEYRRLDRVGLVFIDGYHSERQVRFDYEAFIDKLAPRGFVLFHDSMLVRESSIYGPEHTYETGVKHFIDELKQNPRLQVLDVPFGTGLTLVRTLDGISAQQPLTENEGVRRRPEG